jgi:hypothetical protein
MLAEALATNRIHDLSIAEAACKERKEASGKVVQKYGEIYSHQAQRDIFLDEEDEKEVIVTACHGITIRITINGRTRKYYKSVHVIS